MKSMAHYVANGIETLADLKAALQLAMQLEFSTIPPYLCAQWSIRTDADNDDPSDVADMIQSVVVQEMYHFAQVGNILSAVGGVPDIANPGFLPAYPTQTLPGGIILKNPVDLRPLSADQLLVFEDIEHPQFTPVGPDGQVVAMAPATSIGAFYDTIKACFDTLQPAIDPNAKSTSFPGEVEPIKTRDDVGRVIDRIKDEGEGTAVSPDQIADHNDKVAHYYVFEQIRLGKTFVDVGGHWDFIGADIVFPAVDEFARAAPSDASKAFSQSLQKLMTSLQNVWTTGARPDVGAMFDIQSKGTALIKAGITPEFVWPA